MKRVVSFVLCLALAGCGAINTAPPATAPSPYQRAATVMQDFSQDLLAAQQAEIALRNSGAIDGPAHKALQNAFLYAAQRAVQVDALISSQGQPAAIAVQLTLLSESLGDILASTIHMPTATAAQLRTTIAAIQLVVAGVSTALNLSNVAPTPTSTTELRWTPLKLPLSPQPSRS